MKLRVDGVPIHALLVHFPIAGWTAASALAVAVVAGYPALAAAAWITNAVALSFGVLAIGAGAAELAWLPDEPAVRDHAVAHLSFAAGAWSLYGVMLLLQASGHLVAAAAVGAAAFLVLIAAGHAGARLVFHHGIPRHG